MRPSRHRRRNGKNQTLQQWLVQVATRPDDRGQQWWDDFDAFLRRSRVRLSPIDG